MSTTNTTSTAISFANIRVLYLSDEENGCAAPKPKYSHLVELLTEYDPEGMNVRVVNPKTGETHQEFIVKKTTESAKCGKKGMIFHLSIETLLFVFKCEEKFRKFASMVSSIRCESRLSVFNERTEDSSAMQYFQFYGYLSQQQNMMQDYIRTSTYQKAILSNLSDFRDKVVLDVGAGSGILSFFAQQAGARKVYAVEGSSIAKFADKLVKQNKVDNVIQVIPGKIEEIELLEPVDMIISEPMGYMLLNERMLETYLHAKKWLKKDGKMFPSRGDLHVAPFTDEALYFEQINKVNFWYQEYFHGVNLSSLRESALREYFRQPIVDTFDVRICLAKTQRHIIDFHKAEESDLYRIDIPLEFHILQSGMIHGLAFWFDVAFIGTGATVWLSTAPTEPLTHWYQVRCLLETPIFAKQGQMVTGRVLMVANTKQSYDVTIECKIMGTDTSSKNSLDLKNPYFRYTGVQPQPPPGENTASPSETYWSEVDMQGARQAVNLVNGVIVDGLGHVSLNGGANGGNTNAIQQANIHQGRRDNSAASPRVATTLSNVGTNNSLPCSSATSLQYNQLIGGAVSPGIFAQTPSSTPTSSSATPLNLTGGVIPQSQPQLNMNPNLMIGDYVQGNMGNVLGTTFRQ
ncbi:histone-arginine methyltransferase CARMER isoform X2 [Lepeophtheirus salmonis]|uniref:histone-arginine methyltransferase CARMER isoform X2 n=1 Tax=Lepeophtheirus salmonis TaxID=72036 RepID=UPI001AEA6AF4|nr:histone-arginine methyltransferase CARMER-like isoform X2 [Lepeophtheirus salmonis]